MMKKDYLLLLGSTLITLSLALAVIGWQAPALLGLASDLKLVQVDETVPPFYAGVFRWDDLRKPDLIIPDPLTRVRARPFHPETILRGPHDLLGFRNREIPLVADIIVIGDSQTYGNNAILEHNWPSQLRGLLEGRQNKVYAMATGGWGAAQYLDMFSNAMLFRPKVVVVAFYSGNDSIETFLMAYGNPKWSGLITDPSLSESDIPRTKFPAPESEWWRVKFRDGIETIFTPTLRLAANLKHPLIFAGYKIMAEVAGRMNALAVRNEIQVVYTIIPTKELAYAKKVADDGLEAPENYHKLTTAEFSHIQGFAQSIQAIPGAIYVDSVGPLQRAAMNAQNLYLTDINGHPVAAGYRVIAESVAERIADLLSPIPHGLYGVPAENHQANIVLVNDEGGWLFGSLDLVQKNGWPEARIDMISNRDFDRLPFMGVIDQIDPIRFGPR